MRRKIVKTVTIPAGADPVLVLGLEEEAPDDRPYTEEEVQIVFEKAEDDADGEDDGEEDDA